VLWSGPQTDLVERTPEEKPSAEASTKDGIETVRPCASLLRSRLSIDSYTEEIRAKISLTLQRSLDRTRRVEPSKMGAE